MNILKLMVLGALVVAAPWSLAAQEDNALPPADVSGQAEAVLSGIPPDDAEPAVSDEPAVAAEAEAAEEGVVEAEAAPVAPAQAQAERDLGEEPAPAADSQPVVEAEPPAEAPSAQPAPPEAEAAPAESNAKVEPTLESPRVIYPEDRPAWVDGAPVREGQVDRVAVSSGPHYSQGEARRQLDDAIRQAVSEYLDRHLGAANTTRYIRYQISPVNTYDERPEFSFGPMYQSHALLEFGEGFRQQAERDWKEALTLSRLVKTGLGTGAVFFLLAVVFGYLKADTATRGYYTRRLRFGAATVILALGAIIYFAVRAIPWL